LVIDYRILVPGARRHAGKGAGLEPQVQVLRPEEDLCVRVGRGGRHDRHAGPPGPEHQVRASALCPIRIME